jgi:hypothetical protein
MATADYAWRSLTLAITRYFIKKTYKFQFSQQNFYLLYHFGVSSKQNALLLTHLG